MSEQSFNVTFKTKAGHLLLWRQDRLARSKGGLHWTRREQRQSRASIQRPLVSVATILFLLPIIYCNCSLLQDEGRTSHPPTSPLKKHTLVCDPPEGAWLGWSSNFTSPADAELSSSLFVLASTRGSSSLSALCTGKHEMDRSTITAGGWI